MLETLLNNWIKIYAVVSSLALVVNWVMAKTYSKKEAVEVLTSRVTKIEDKVDSMPSKDDLHRLDKQLVELGAQITAITPQLVAIQRMIDMLTENELRGEK